MRRIERLKLEARRSAQHRGHNMSRFMRMHDKTSVSYCNKCGMTMYVQSYCFPNEIDVSGQAVALNCTK